MKVSQLQDEKGDSLVQKSYSNTDAVQQGMASLRALNALASRAGTTAKEFAKHFDINNETKNAVAMANTIVSSRISEQSRNEFVGRPSSSIESEGDGNVEDGEEEENDDQEKENEGGDGDAEKEMMKNSSAAITTLDDTAVLHRSYKDQNKVNKKLPCNGGSGGRAKQLSMKSRKNALMVRRKRKVPVEEVVEV